MVIFTATLWLAVNLPLSIKVKMSVLVPNALGTELIVIKSVLEAIEKLKSELLVLVALQTRALLSPAGPSWRSDS